MNETFNQKLYRWNKTTSQYYLPLDLASGATTALLLTAAKVDPVITIAASFGVQLYVWSVLTDPKNYS